MGNTSTTLDKYMTLLTAYTRRGTRQTLFPNRRLA